MQYYTQKFLTSKVKHSTNCLFFSSKLHIKGRQELMSVPASEQTALSSQNMQDPQYARFWKVFSVVMHSQAYCTYPFTIQLIQRKEPVNKYGKELSSIKYSHTVWLPIIHYQRPGYFCSSMSVCYNVCILHGS